MADPLEAFRADLASLVDSARTGQQILGIIGQVVHVATDVGELAERRPDLSPELHAVLEALQSATGALTRAQETASAMTDVAIANNTYDEGSPS